MRAVDCQGFAGGFTLGVVQAGFELVGKREMSAGFGVANCEAQRHLLGSSWKTEAVDPGAWSVPDDGAEYVFGNPPCSGFSGLSSKEFRGVNSPINDCMWAFVEYTARVRPLVAVFESVRGAYSKGHSLMRDLRARLEARTGVAWDLHHVVHDAYALGGPAVRRRYFWVASRVPFGVEHPVLPVAPTLYDAIGDLESLPLAPNTQRYRTPPTRWSYRHVTVHGGVDGHATIDNPHSRRLTALAETIDWPQGDSVGKTTRRCYEKFGRLPEEWRNIEASIVKRNFEFGFSSNPSRWRYDRPARVVTGAGPGIGLHPAVNRTFTHREVARIMGFPDDWLIEPLIGNPGVTATWGKGITVDAGRWIAHWVRSSIEGNPGTLPTKTVGSREYEVTVSKPRVDDTVEVSPVPVAATMKGSTMTDNEANAQPEPEPAAPTAPKFFTASPPTTEATANEAAETPAQPTEAAEATERQAAPETAAKAKRGRGKGRPTAVVERDNTVLELLREYPSGLTRDQLVDALRDQIEPDDDVKRSTRVYQSLVRLTWPQNGSLVERVRDGRTHVWKAAK